MRHYSRVFEIDTEINYEQIKFKIFWEVKKLQTMMIIMRLYRTNLTYVSSVVM